MSDENLRIAAARCLFLPLSAFWISPENTKIEWTLSDVLHAVHGTFQLKSGSVHFDPDRGKAGGDVVVMSQAAIAEVRRATGTPVFWNPASIRRCVHAGPHRRNGSGEWRVPREDPRPFPDVKSWKVGGSKDRSDGRPALTLHSITASTGVAFSTPVSFTSSP